MPLSIRLTRTESPDCERFYHCRFQLVVSHNQINAFLLGSARLLPSRQVIEL